MNFIVLIAALVATAHSRLNLEENQDRLEKCGKEEMWMWRHFDVNEQWMVGAVPVSPRHFLTLSNMIFSKFPWNDYIQWSHNDTIFVANCGNGISSIEIPSDALPFVKLVPPKDHSNPEWPTLIPVKAWLLNYCDQAVKGSLFSSSTPLLIEVEKDIDVGFPCLTGSDVKVGDTVKAQGVDWNHNIAVTSVNITQLSGLYIFSTLHGISSTYGSFLWKEANSKSMLIGAIHYNRLSSDETQNLYYFVPYFNNAICEVAGICDPIATTKASTIAPVPKKPSQLKKDEKKKEEVKKEENGNKEIGIKLVFVFVLYFLCK